MNYLQDKKIKKRKFIYIISFCVIFISFFYFRYGIYDNLSYVSNIIFRPFLILQNNISNKLSNLNSFFISKNFLYKENEDLKLKLNENISLKENYNSILNENISLKEILNRKSEKKEFILGNILSKPNQSLYDTLLIDVGENFNVLKGKIVFAFGNIPIGYIDTIYPKSSKVILFSNNGEKTQAILSGKDVFVEIVGRGGGNFELKMPRDFILNKGEEIVLSGSNPYVVARVETIISDPRDSFLKALLISPVNIFELKFVEVER